MPRLLKKFFFFALLSVILCDLLALSVSYQANPMQGFDSEVMLRGFGKVESDSGAGVNKDLFPNFIHPIKGEVPTEVFVHFAGAGEEIYQRYGHTGLVLKYADGDEIFFDWGVFNSAEPNFVNNFIHGNLYYKLSVHTIDWWKAELERTGRTSRVYKLRISEKAKKNIQDFLLYNSKPEHSVYLYDFFKDNCSTRLRDVLNVALDNRLKEKYDKIPMASYRSCVERGVRYSPPMEFFYNFGQGSGQDKTISYYDAMFLPEFLELGLLDFYVDNFYEYDESLDYLYTKLSPTFSIFPSIFRPSLPNVQNSSQNNTLSAIRSHEPLLELLEKEDWEIKFPPSVVPGKMLRADARFVVGGAMVLVVLFLALAFMDERKGWLWGRRVSSAVAFVVELVFSLLSLICLYASSFTIHTFFYANYNLIFINPLLLVLCYYDLRFLFAKKGTSITKQKARVARGHLFFFILDAVMLVMKIFYTQNNLYLIVAAGIYNLVLALTFRGEKILFRGRFFDKLGLKEYN